MQAPDWQPSASLANLHLRAAILAKIRQFFAERNVLEVETPLLAASTATDQHLHSFQTTYYLAETARTYYLQTSPEFAMKRLLAAGIGAIYQIGKAFRNQGEQGRWHNPEFTLLEWYRPGFSLHQLLDEAEALLQTVLACSSAKRYTYADLFKHFIGIDPHQANCVQLRHVAQQHLGVSALADLRSEDRDTWLQLLLSHMIEPQLTGDRPIFIDDFPASQAALARIRPGPIPVAERAEVYFQGLELANAFYELTDANEQKRRFKTDLTYRQAAGLTSVPLDGRLLSALQHGLPDCAGIALGVDRLVLLAAKADTLDEVLSFAFERA